MQKLPKIAPEQLLAGELARDLAERPLRKPQVLGEKLERTVPRNSAAALSTRARARARASRWRRRRGERAFGRVAIARARFEVFAQQFDARARSRAQ